MSSRRRYAVSRDLVTPSGDLSPGQSRTVDVTFTPPAAGTFSGVLRATATDLPAATAIHVSGAGQ